MSMRFQQTAMETMAAQFESMNVDDLAHTPDADGPLFRKRLADLEQMCDHIAEERRQMLNVTKQLCETYTDLNARQSSFVDSMKKISSLGGIQLPADFNTFFDAMDTLRKQYLSLEQQFSGTFSADSDWLERSYRTSKDIRKWHESAEGEYNSLLYKSLTMPSESPADVLRESDKAVLIAKGHLRLSRFDYVSRLHDCITSSRVSYLAQLSCTMAAFGSHVNAMKKTLDGLTEPRQQLEDLIAEETRHEATVKQDRKNKRRELEKVITLHRESLQPSDLSSSDGASLPRFSDEPRKTDEKKGYLFKKNVKDRNIQGAANWKRRWCVIENGELKWWDAKAWRDMLFQQPKGRVKMHLATVKVNFDQEKGERNRFVFQVVTPDKSYVFQADGQAQLDSWLECLREAIMNCLNEQPHSLSGAQTPRSQQTGQPVSLDTNLEPVEEEKNSTLHMLWAVEGNSTCADCDATYPDWASINLGLLLCLRCSGVHRSMGTHISKVRSATLDVNAWDTNLLSLMQSVGNATSNRVWLANPPEGCLITEATSREVAEEHIRAKYEQKAYIQPPPPQGEDYPAEEAMEDHLLQASAAGDVEAVLRALAAGAEVNQKSPMQTDFEGRTALHAAVTSNHTTCMELLLQNGADLDIQDTGMRSPLHIAAANGHVEACSALVARGAKLWLTDLVNQTAFDIAYHKKYSEIVSLLQSAQAKEDEVREEQLQFESMEHLRRLQKTLEGKKVPLTQPHRRWVRDGPVIKTNSHGSPMLEKKSEAFLFLFNDLLLYTRPYGKPGNFKLHGELPLLRTQVRALDDTSNGAAFEILGYHKPLIFACPKKSLRDEWVAALDHTATAWQQRCMIEGKDLCLENSFNREMRDEDMTIADLKKVLSSNNIDTSDCTEKSDLVAKLRSIPGLNKAPKTSMTSHFSMAGLSGSGDRRR